jgi:hypothetical protein
MFAGMRLASSRVILLEISASRLLTQPLWPQQSMVEGIVSLIETSGIPDNRNSIRWLSDPIP